MPTTVTDLDTQAPMERAEAIALGREAYIRLADVLDGLDDDQWAAPTDCTLWTVRDLAGHVAGMMRSMATIRGFVGEQVRSMTRARRDGGEAIDAMTAIQVESMADATPAELVERMRALVEPAVAGRSRLPGPLARTMKAPQVVNGATEWWSLAYLYGPILTRDTWLHRVADVARAVDVTPRLDAAHDGRIVADVVAEWARRHGQPVELTLTGPAGGTFRAGTGGPRLEADTIEWCRMLSGRAEPTHPLYETQVPF